MVDEPEVPEPYSVAVIPQCPSHIAGDTTILIEVSGLEQDAVYDIENEALDLFDQKEQALEAQRHGLEQRAAAQRLSALEDYDIELRRRRLSLAEDAAVDDDDDDATITDAGAVSCLVCTSSVQRDSGLAKCTNTQCTYDVCTSCAKLWPQCPACANHWAIFGNYQV